MSTVVYSILLTIGVILAIILLAPLHFDIEGEYADSLSFQGRLRWAGGLIGFEVLRREGNFQWAAGIFGIKKYNPKSEGKNSEKEKKLKDEKSHALKKEKRNSGNSIWSYLNLQLFIAVKDVFYKMMRAMHLKINLSGICGFDDPSLTGVMVGLLAALDIKSSSLNITPDFSREVIDIRGSFKGWIVPLQILAVGLVFLLMKPVRAIWWPKIKIRKKQKEAVQYA